MSIQTFKRYEVWAKRYKTDNHRYFVGSRAGKAGALRLASSTAHGFGHDVRVVEVYAQHHKSEAWDVTGLQWEWTGKEIKYA